MNRAALWLGFLIIAACSATKPSGPNLGAASSHPAASAPVTMPLDAGPSPSAVADGGDEPFVADPKLDAKLDELERVRDWRSTVLGTGAPNPPVLARTKQIPAKGVFRTAAIATIRAYHYLRSYSNVGEQELDDQSDVPYTKDGRLDGHVVLPEATFSDEERDRVIALIRAAEQEEKDRKAGVLHTRRPTLRCPFDPHHALVMFDKAGSPIAKILVCFSCGEILATPADAALGGESTQTMSGEESKAIGEILDRHGLAAWTYRSSERQALWEYENKKYGSGNMLTALGRERFDRRRKRPSGAPSDVTPRNGTAIDRERFCVWLRAEMSSRLPSGPAWAHIDGGFECNSGIAYSFSTEAQRDACEKKPICEVPFGKMESCFRESFLKGPEQVCAHGAGAACEGMLDCLPYIRYKATP